MIVIIKKIKLWNLEESMGITTLYLTFEAQE